MYKYLILFFIFPIISSAQYIGGQEVDESKITDWIPKFEIEYAGTYHFGESESESDLHLFFSGDMIVGQIRMGYWDEKSQWILKYINLNDIKISKKGDFTSKEYSGKFVKYKNAKCLKINNPWISWDDESTYDLGVRDIINFEHIFYGKFAFASYKLLTKEDLQIFTEEELTIIRNEIFARYGYIFKSGGKMDTYFKKQEWYNPQHKNVDTFLTTIEKQNIRLLLDN